MFQRKIMCTILRISGA